MSLKKKQFKQTLLDMVKDDNYIPGIYNYCDRWCERCPATSKCLSYNHSKTLMDSEGRVKVVEATDEIEYWENFKVSLEVAIEILQEEALKMGFDINEKLDKAIEEPGINQAEYITTNYGTEIYEWLKNNYDNLDEKADQLLTKKDKDKALAFAEALEVIQWYSLFIAPKIHRAFTELGERQSTITTDAINDPLADNLGSVKIALIAIERSISALTILYTNMPDFEDDFLHFLTQLSQAKKLIFIALPAAMDFKRPGLDS